MSGTAAMNCIWLGAIGGPVTRVPDTPANRETFGSTGTAAMF